MADDPRTFRSIFAEVIELPPAQRQARLDELTAGDEALKARVQALLDADPGIVEALDRGAWEHPDLASIGEGADDDHEDDDALPASIGPYRVTKALGEGGFGVVYLAEQAAPLRREVAVKVIKRGMDTKQVIARFRAEEQALALMSHPSVAKVLDAGTTEDGRPYFVMEYVPGRPITKHCDEHRLTIDERLALFEQVCEAVQHAHQKGVIHRDLKPSNILVEETEHGGDRRAVPKVIDFGIAKALHQPLTEETFFTEHGQLVGTPEYMAPEQAGMSAGDVDARSDIYSLGVLLYELLSGAPPYSSTTLRKAGRAEIQRIIREEVPRKPSTRVDSADGDSREIARRRGAEPRALAQQLRGDLDWIVLKCLEKDPARRYETANGLGVEIRRFRGHEAILARPPSVAYRLRRFARRQRTLVAAASVVAVALAVGGAIATWQWQERRLETASKLETQAILERIVDIGDPWEQVRVDSPEAAQAFHLLGVALLNQGNAAAAARSLRPAYDGLREMLGPDDERTLRAMRSLAHALADGGADYRDSDPSQLLDESVRLYRECAERAERTFGPDHPFTLGSLDALGMTLADQGNLAPREKAMIAEGVELLRTVIERIPPHVTLVDEDYPAATFHLAHALDKLDEKKEALEILEPQLAALRRERGNLHPSTLSAIELLASMLRSVDGRRAESARLYRERFDLGLEVFDPPTRSMLNALNSSAAVLYGLGRNDEAAEPWEQAFELREQVLGRHDPDTLESLHNLVSAQIKQEDIESVLARSDDLMQRVRNAVKLPSVNRMRHTLMYGVAMRQAGRFEQAEAALLQAHRNAVELAQRQVG